MPRSNISQPKRAVTIKTVAEALKLSTSTVSRALRQSPRLPPQTIRRVLEMADVLGYRRDFRGVNLRTGKTFTLCALLASNPSPEFGDPAAMHLIQGLIEGAEGSDFKMVIRPVEGGQAGQLAAVRDAVAGGRFDGLILDHTEPQDQRVKYLLENGIPFVTFGRTELFSEHAYFDIDNDHAAHLATSHLIKEGHERIALIDPPSQYLFTGHRRRGYQRALEEAGIHCDPALLLEAAITPSHARDDVARLLKLKAPPTGFVTGNEMATIGAVAACRRLAPARLKSIRFVSRDGTRFFDYFEPRVSSCYYPLLEAGRELSAMLIKAVQGVKVAGLQRVERTELLVR